MMLPCFSKLIPLPAVVALLIGFVASNSTAQQDIDAQIPGIADLPDVTDELQAQIENGGGSLELEDRVYRITRALEINLVKHGSASVRTRGGSATLIMDGAGPAIRLTGSHEGSADPKSFKPATWNERMPIVEGIVILGHHPEAVGVELVQCVQPIVSRVSVRGCLHGIHLTTRNRNVTISDCHLYENEGVGIYLDDLSLHQINISNCHISYNRAGGIVVRDGNVRNLQVTGCDIEANMPHDTETPTTAANILIDVAGSPDDKAKSVAEIAITGCTIQHSANYGAAEDKTVAPGGANIRLAGKEIWPIDSVTISGNVISDTSTNVVIDHSMDVTLCGNTFFAPKPDHLIVTNSQRIVVTGNSFNPRQFERPGALRFTNCSDCLITGSSIHAARSTDGAVILDNCEGFVINGLNLNDCARGLVLKNSRDTLISNCRVARTDETAADIEVDAASRDIALSANRFSGTQSVATEALAK